MVRTGVRCERVYSFHSGRVLYVLRIMACILRTPVFISDLGIVFACAELRLCAVRLLTAHSDVVVLLLLPYATRIIYGSRQIDIRYGTAEAGCVRSILL